jgi:hypothetical protein
MKKSKENRCYKNTFYRNTFSLEPFGIVSQISGGIFGMV